MPGCSTRPGACAPPCVAIAKTVSRHRAHVTIQKGAQSVNAGSVMDLLSLAAVQGTELVLSATGDEADRALADPLPGATTRLHQDLEQSIAKHIETFALQKAMDEIWKAVEQTNAFVAAKQPWKTTGDERAATLATAVDAIASIGHALVPFLPDTSARIVQALNGKTRDVLFPKDLAAHE